VSDIDPSFVRFRRPADLSFEAAALETAAPVFIELGESGKKPVIVRDGASVAVVRPLPDKLGDLLAGSDLVIFKVVSQSIAPGAVVPKGTSVDLVLAPPFRIPLNVFDNVHLALADQPVEAVFNNFIRNDPEVRNVLARNDSFESLSDRDKTILTQRAQAQNVQLDEQAGTNLAGLFGALQAANTFGA
jgi:hypothetical protein